MSLIQAAINDQARQLTKGNPCSDKLVMGHGTNVVLAVGGAFGAIDFARDDAGEKINVKVPA